MDILTEIRNRKSPLVFSDEDVEKEKIDALIEVARWAPSCYNNQSWNYVFVHRKGLSRKHLEDALFIGNSWAKRAPYLVVVGADPEKDCATNNLPYFAYNAGLSVMSLVLEAEHQGLRVHQMAGWKEDKVKEAVRFPDNYRVIVLFALGYERDPRSIWNELDDRIKNRLMRQRERRPVHENFFYDYFTGS